MVSTGREKKNRSMVSLKELIFIPRLWYGLVAAATAAVLAWFHLMLLAQPQTDKLHIVAKDLWGLFFGLAIAILVWSRLLLSKCYHNTLK